MARMNMAAAREFAWRLRIHGLRLARRAGAPGLAAAVCAAVGLAALSAAEQRRQRLEALPATAEVVLPAREGHSAPIEDDAARYARFQSHLLPVDALPDAVKDLFRAAEDAGVALTAGEYRREPDPAGGFMRYRISLPVSGEPGAALDFMLGALRRQKSLALESASFRREGRDADSVEGRIQFVLLTRLPPDPAAREKSR